MKYLQKIITRGKYAGRTLNVVRIIDLRYLMRLYISTKSPAMVTAIKKTLEYEKTINPERYEMILKSVNEDDTIYG